MLKDFATKMLPVNKTMHSWPFNAEVPQCMFEYFEIAFDGLLGWYFRILAAKGAVLKHRTVAYKIAKRAPLLVTMPYGTT